MKQMKLGKSLIEIQFFSAFEAALLNMRRYLRYRYLRYLIPLIGSMAVFAVLLRQIDWHKMFWAAQHFDFLTLALVSFLAIPFVLLKAFKWHRLLCVAIPEASFRLALRSFLLGVTVSLFTPGQVGELARAACLTGLKGNRTSVLMLTLMDKLVDVTVLMMLCSISLWTYSALLGLASVTGAALLAMGIWAGPQWLKQLKWLKHLIPMHHVWTLRCVAPGRLIVFNVILSLCCYAVMMLQFHLLLSAINPVPLWMSSSVLPSILLLSAMPVFINGFGGREGVATLLLGYYAVPGEQAVLAAFLLYVASSLLPGGVGMVFGLQMFRRKWRIRSCRYQKKQERLEFPS